MSVSTKAGDTFSMDGLYSDASDVPINLTGYTVTSQIKRQNSLDLIGSLTATLANQTTSPGVFTLSATATATALWATGTFVCDVKFVNGSTVERSVTFSVVVNPAVTA